MEGVNDEIGTEGGGERTRKRLSRHENTVEKKISLDISATTKKEIATLVQFKVVKFEHEDGVKQKVFVVAADVYKRHTRIFLVPVAAARVSLGY